MVTLLNQGRPSLRLLNDLTCCPLCGVVAWSCLELEPTLLRGLEASRSQGNLTMFTHSLIHSSNSPSCILLFMVSGACYLASLNI